MSSRGASPTRQPIQPRHHDRSRCRRLLASCGGGCSSPPPSCPPEHARYVKHLVENCSATAHGQRLAQDFVDMLRTRAQGRLGPWLEEAAACPVAEFRDFAAGLRRDLGAVEAALTYGWSNGQTEGEITKLKMLKRQMYGRASVPLLRQRLLLAA
ncbi:MAG: transposase [Minicystis sp.]